MKAIIRTSEPNMVFWSLCQPESSILKVHSGRTHLAITVLVRDDAVEPETNDAANLDTVLDARLPCCANISSSLWIVFSPIKISERLDHNQRTVLMGLAAGTWGFDNDHHP